MAATVRFDNSVGGFDLALDDRNRLLQGDPLVTRMLLSSYTDTPGDVGDPFPEGTNRTEYWALAFDADAQGGSKLWMIPHVKPIAKALAFAPIWAEEAYEHFVTRGEATSVSAEATRLNRLIKLRTIVTLVSGRAREFELLIPYTT
jgi:phage gp46-like protein